MDEYTAQLFLPLPHPDHLLMDDVIRLRTALQRLDTHLVYGDFVLGLAVGMGLEPAPDSWPEINNPADPTDPQAPSDDAPEVLGEQIHHLLLSAFEQAIAQQ